MKILQVAKFPPSIIGGIEKLINELNKDLNDKNVKNDFLCFNLSRKTEINIDKKTTVFKCGTLFEIASIPFSITMFYFLRKLVGNYDVIHLHSPNPIAEIYLLMIKKRINNLTVHFHADVSKKLGYRFYWPIQKAILRQSKRIITTTKALSKCKNLECFQDKIRVIPSYLSEDDYVLKDFPDKNNIVERYRDMKFIVFVGRFTKYKNIDMLINAYSRVKHLTKLVLIGNGKEMKNLENLIYRKQLSKNIFIEKNINDDEKKYLLSKAYFSVLPSTSSAEAYGYVQVESMAQSTPVISFDIKNSGVSEINVNYKTGLILQIGKTKNETIRNLSEAIEKLLLRDDLRKSLSENSFKESLKYSARVVIKKYINFF